MALVTTMLSSMGGSGGGSGGSVSGTILAPVIAASTAALTVTYANGSAGIGATLTNAGAQAAFSLDGATRAVGTRVLIKDQASGLENGVYIVTTAGSGAANWVLTRTSDFDEIGEMPVGVMVAVAAGTVNAATLWEQTATVTAIGTDDITFTEFANATLTTATIGNLTIASNSITATNAGGDVVLVPSTTGVVEIGANATHASTIRWKEDTDNGLNYITLSAPASLATDTAYEWPAAAPTVSGYFLSSTTAGVWTWVPPSKEVVIDQTTTPVSIVANQVYIANNGALVTLNMPATAAVGDVFEVDGLGAGGWLLQMNTGQICNLGSSPTSSAGSLASTNRYDGVKIRCVAANTTFVALRAVGNITVA